MIKLVTGNIFDAKTLFITVPVNTLGYMGKGLAKDAVKKHPELNIKYKKKTYCNRRLYKSRRELLECMSKSTVKTLTVGTLYVDTLYPHKGYYSFVLMFPTKKHFKDNSKYSYIRDGLKYMVANESEMVITSISFPLLGAGLGGLNNKAVLKLMINELRKSRISNICIYVPEELLVYGNKLLKQFN